jgi:hypothetical protein
MVQFTNTPLGDAGKSRAIDREYEKLKQNQHK